LGSAPVDALEELERFWRDDLRIYVLRSAAGVSLACVNSTAAVFRTSSSRIYGIIPEVQGQALAESLLRRQQARNGWRTDANLAAHRQLGPSGSRRLYNSLGFRLFEERDEPVGPL